MNSQFNSYQNGIYFLNPQSTRQQIVNAIRRCLCKADALVALLILADLEALGADTISDYLWALGDLIHESKLLQKLITQEKE